MDFVKSLLDGTSFKSKWKVQLKLYWDADMCLFFEKGIRGGVSCISMRFRKDNDKYSKSYNPKQKSKVLNFYGYSMSKFLPRNRFNQMDRS